MELRPITAINVHGLKLDALAQNPKLPTADKPRVIEAMERYKAWVAAMDSIAASGDELLQELMRLLVGYKRFIEIDLITTLAMTSSTAKRDSIRSTTPSWRNSFPV